MKEYDIEHKPGTYAILLKNKLSKNIRVGKLGIYIFKPGYYVYLGSALGPGGLHGRLNRHIRRDKKKHWHIDYIRSRMKLLEVWYAVQEENSECLWASKLKLLSKNSKDIINFGSSDCKCKSHLIFFPELPHGNIFNNLLTVNITLLTLKRDTV
ncbi:MAG: GIY-YIG nuclease family protein [bacterium]|nr:GIY-YIG nuclease family protein [bacterium]